MEGLEFEAKKTNVNPEGLPDVELLFVKESTEKHKNANPALLGRLCQIILILLLFAETV